MLYLLGSEGALPRICLAFLQPSLNAYSEYEYLKTFVYEIERKVLIIEEMWERTRVGEWEGRL